MVELHAMLDALIPVEDYHKSIEVQIPRKKTESRGIDDVVSLSSERER